MEEKENWWSDKKRYAYRCGESFLTDIGRKLQKIPYYSECIIAFEDKEQEYYTLNTIDSMVAELEWEADNENLIHEFYKARMIFKFAARGKRKKRMRK